MFSNTLLFYCHASQLEIGAYKECVNSLSQAVAYSKGSGSKKIPYWLALLAYARRSYGDLAASAKLAWEAMHVLNDPTFLPQNRSKASLEKLVREYEELDDVPVYVEGEFDDIDRAKLLLCVEFSAFYNTQIGTNDLRVLGQEKYGFTNEEIIEISDWYRCVGLISSFKQNNVDIWHQLHFTWPSANRGQLMQSDAGAVRRIYRRLTILYECKKLKPQYRAEAIHNPYGWYATIAPEMVKNSLSRMQESFSLIEGNLKYSSYQNRHLWEMALAHESLGDFKLFNHYTNRMLAIKYDSEALQDQKAVGYQQQTFAALYAALNNLDSQKMHEYYNKLINMQELFPDTKAKFPSGGWEWNGKKIMAFNACLEEDWNTAISILKDFLYPFSARGLEGLLFPGWTHIEAFHSQMIEAIIMIYVHQEEKGEVDPIHGKALAGIRKTIEMIAKFNPGTFRCGLQVYVARITLLLKDRPFKDVFAKLEEALEYSIELEVLPTSTALLKAEIARWEGNVDALGKLIGEYETMEFKYQAGLQKRTLEKLKSGELKAVEMEFVPEVVELILTDDEKLAMLKKEMKSAKQQVKEIMASGTDEELVIARAHAKAIRVSIKEMEKAIAEQSKTTIDQAKVDELKAKIADAQARQEQAFDDEDDDAEEAAIAEAKALRAELEGLLGGATSIPKKKLIDATNKDAEINK